MTPSEVLTEPPKRTYAPRKPGFDPSPLLRQLELTLPDLHEIPRREGWDNGRRIVTDAQIAEALGVSVRAVQRWRHDGVRLHWAVADRLAVRAGLDAALLWDDWYADIPDGQAEYFSTWYAQNRERVLAQRRERRQAKAS